MADNSSGRIPFFVENGKIVFGLVAENNRIIDREYIRKECGDALASLVPEKVIMYGLPRGKIEQGETPELAAGRETAEEIHYNATGQIVKDEGRDTEVPPHQGKIEKNYLVKEIEVKGKRGDYTLYLYVDRIEPYSFAPKPMMDKKEKKIEGRIGNTFQEGGAWGSMQDLNASMELLKKLSNERNVMANAGVKKLVDDQIKSMASQLEGMQQIEDDLIRMLRAQDETVSPAGGKSI